MSAQQLVTFIARSLVEEPDKVTVNSVERGRTVVLELRVAPGDMGRVIGRQGRIANAIRAVLKSATANSRQKYIVDIL